MAAPADPWAFLNGRFEYLEEQLVMITVAEEGLPWIKFINYHTTNDGLKLVREALLLTGAMGTYVGTEVHREWKRKMDEVMLTGMPFRRLGARAPWPAFNVGGAFTLDRIHEWGTMMDVFLGYDDLSESFEEDWNQLYATVQEHGLSADHPHEIPIHVEFSFSNNDDAHVEELQIIIKCFKSFYQNSATAERLHPYRPRFNLKTVGLSLRHMSVTPQTIPHLLELLALDISIDSLFMPREFPREGGPPWRDAWASLLFTVFGHPHAKVTTGQPIKSVHFDYKLEESFRAFCSVLIHASNVQGLSYYGPSDREALKWKWLYYALFSEASVSSIRSVVFHKFDDVLVNTRDVNPLKAKYPHTQLLDDSTADDDVDFGSIQLAKGTVIRFFPFGQHDKTVIQDPDGQVVQIIRNDPASTVIDILVPGYGNGFVERASVFEKRHRSMNSQEQSSLMPMNTSAAQRSLLVFPCNYYIGAEDQLSQLIAFAGQRFDAVHMSARPSDAAYNAMMLDKCPNLTHFGPVTISESIDAVLSAFEKGCAIRSLHFNIVDNNDDAIVPLLEQLADPATQLAKKLNRLEISKVLTDKEARIVEEIIANNKRLHYLEVTVSRRTFTKKRMQDALDGEPCAIERIVPIPLSLCTKCAILSIFASHQQPALHFDRLVLTQIFEFAAKSVKSQIVIFENEREEDP